MSEFFREISDGVIEGFCIDTPFPCLRGWFSHAGQKPNDVHLNLANLDPSPPPLCFVLLLNGEKMVSDIDWPFPNLWEIREFTRLLIHRTTHPRIKRGLSTSIRLCMIAQCDGEHIYRSM